MNEVSCPVCQSANHQSFWFWEKEDSLVRQWAMDARVHFSICRDCSLIFQNPLVPSAADDFSFGGLGAGEAAELSPKEPLEWLRQFTQRGKDPLRALEIYAQAPRFTDALKNENWDIEAISVESLASHLDAANDGDAPNDFSLSGQYDLIFCLDVLNKTSRPVQMLSRLHQELKPDGGVLVEIPNPFAMPRLNQICLTGQDVCVFSFQTLIFALWKAGFSNQAAEICGKSRCFCTKIDPNPNAEAPKLAPKNHWSHLTYRFQRNYYWAWTAGFLEKYRGQAALHPDFLSQTRKLLRKRPEDLAVIRDVCGAALLFIQEVDSLRQTLSQDWSLTLQRIFEIIGKDYALYDLLQTAKPIPHLGALPDIERFYLNDKMIFMTNTDYFERFFTQEEAAMLCEGIIQSGRETCKTLSSFL